VYIYIYIIIIYIHVYNALHATTTPKKDKYIYIGMLDNQK